MKILEAYFIVCLVVLGTASGTVAEQYVNPCEEDIARFCSNITPGAGRIADCLSQYEAQLSPACRSMHVADIAEVLGQMQQRCKDDFMQFCGAERQTPGIELLKCMRLSRTSLSPDCRKNLDEALQLLRY